MSHNQNCSSFSRFSGGRIWSILSSFSNISLNDLQGHNALWHCRLKVYNIIFVDLDYEPFMSKILLQKIIKRFNELYCNKRLWSLGKCVFGQRERGFGSTCLDMPLIWHAKVSPCGELWRKGRESVLLKTREVYGLGL